MVVLTQAIIGEIKASKPKLCVSISQIVCLQTTIIKILIKESSFTHLFTAYDIKESSFMLCVVVDDIKDVFLPILTCRMI